MRLPKKVIREAHELGRRLSKHADKVKTPYALAMWMTKRKYGYDPLPEPYDYWVSDDVMLRLVPEIDGLVEIAVYVPGDVLNRVKKVFKEHGYTDVEIGKDRVIRRGRVNKATNIFIMRR